MTTYYKICRLKQNFKKTYQLTKNKKKYAMNCKLNLDLSTSIQMETYDKTESKYTCIYLPKYICEIPLTSYTGGC